MDDADRNEIRRLIEAEKKREMAIVNLDVELQVAYARIKELELLGQSLLTALGTGRMNDAELVGDFGALGLDVVNRFRRALAGKEKP